MITRPPAPRSTSSCARAMSASGTHSASRDRRLPSTSASVSWAAASALTAGGKSSDMAREVNLGDTVDPAWGDRLDMSGRMRIIGDDHVLSAQLPCASLLTVSDAGDHRRTVPDGHLCRDRADPTRRTVDENVQAVHRAVGEYRSIAGDAGDSQACGLLGEKRSSVALAPCGRATASASGTTTYSAAVPKAR